MPPEPPETGDGALCACGYVLSFSDGGPDEECVLANGVSFEECERIRTLVPGVAYSGSRPGVKATFIIAYLEPPNHAD